MELGLLISALVKDESQAMPTLVLIAMAQLVLCGALVPVSVRPGMEQIALLLPSRWGFAVASLVNIHVMERSTVDSLRDHDAVAGLGDIAVLLVIAVACTAAVASGLRELDPTRRPDTDGRP